MKAIQTAILSLTTVASLSVLLVSSAKRPVYELDMVSERSFEETVASLKQAVADEKFSLLFEIDLQAKLKEKSIKVEPTTILGVCSGKYSSMAMAQDMRIVSQLPCRISVYRRNGKVHVQSMNPMLINDMYQGDDMHGIATAVDKHVRRMMLKATGKD